MSSCSLGWCDVMFRLHWPSTTPPLCQIQVGILPFGQPRFLLPCYIPGSIALGPDAPFQSYPAPPVGLISRRGDDTAEDRHFSVFDHFYSLFKFSHPRHRRQFRKLALSSTIILELQTIRPTRPPYALRRPHYFQTLRFLGPCGKCVAPSHP